MNWLQVFQRRWRALLRRHELDSRMDDEMRSHVEMQTAENIAAGMDARAARYAALKQFGWVESVKDRCRDRRRGAWLADFLRDLGYGARALRKSPGFTAAAALTLALGIGANAGIFSLVNALLLRALPYPAPERLAVVWASNSRLKLGLPVIPPANADVAAWRKHTESFASVAAFAPATADLAEAGGAERIGAARVTAGFFETLGITPLLGRTFSADEDKPGAAPAVMISYGLWQRRFGGDEALPVRTIAVNGNRRTVVGILPPEFDLPRGAEWPAYFGFAGRTDIWLPLAFSAGEWEARDERGLMTLGRLKAGVGARQAQAELDQFAARQAADDPPSHENWTLRLCSLRRQLAGRSERPVMILFAATGALLLIACVNVASLALARGAARRKELTIRAALGAGRARLIRQLLGEASLLALLGGGGGLVLAKACLRLFLGFNPTGYTRLDDADLDPLCLGFTALTAALTTLVFGLAPALEASRVDLREALQDGGRDAGRSVRRRARSWLVGSEVALAIVLLSTAGLLARSFLRVQSVNPGFRAESALCFEVQLPDAGYPTDARKVAGFQRLLAGLQASPGVRAAGAISYLPLGGGDNLGSFTVEGTPRPRPGEEPSSERRTVTAGYFAAMSIPVRRGRAFLETDAADHPLVAVINETMAREFFGPADPVGKRFKLGSDGSGPWRTVVGVVADVKSSSLEAEIRPQLYLPHGQWPWASMTIIVRTKGDPATLGGAVRAELKRLDPALPAARMRWLREVVSQASAPRRFQMALMVFFAATALLLAAVGIYGLVAYLTQRRAHEMGVRLALGATRSEILRLVVGQGMRPVALGSMCGLAGSLAAARLVAKELYGTAAFDPLTLGGMVALLFLVALVACWLPARRAAASDPMQALRASR